MRTSCRATELYTEQRRQEGVVKPKELQVKGNKSGWLLKSFLPSEDGQERPLRFLQGHSKVVELLLHQEAGGLLRKIHSHHGTRGEEEAEKMKTGLKMGLENKIPEMFPWFTCGPCEPCQRHRWRRRLQVWTETPWRSRSAPGWPLSAGHQQTEQV